MGMTQNPYGRNGANRQRLGTPHWFLRALRTRDYRLALDVCAEGSTAVCRRFFTRADDGLAQPWEVPRGAWAWCNPPFSSAEAWVAKAVHESQANKTGVIMLLPFQPGTKWWIAHHHQTQRIEIIVPRLNYWDPITRQLRKNAAFNSCLWFLCEVSGARRKDPDLLIAEYWRVKKPRRANR